MNGRIASVLLGVVITGAVLWFLITPEVVADLRTVAAVANWWMLTLAVLINPIIQWLRAWRFGMMTHGTLAAPDARLVRISFQLNFLNFALPFRLGELGYPLLMQRAYREPVIRSVAILLLARLFDLCTVTAILLGLAAFVGLGGTPEVTLILWLLAAAFALGPIGLILGWRVLTPLLRRFRLTKEGRLPNASRAAQFAAVAVSFAIWLVFGGMASLTARAVGDAITPATALLGASAGNLAFALPINGIGGLGPSQAAFVAAVTRVGVPWNEAVVAALALYLVTLTGAVLFGGTLTGFFRRPQPDSGTLGVPKRETRAKPCRAGDDQIDAEEDAEHVEARDRPADQDDRAEQKGDDA
jgi:hypothetical protein